MTDYNKQILNTIGLVAENALAKHTGFDKTLVGTVIDASRAESKNYKLQYNEITFDAYGVTDEHYRANDQVYFTVPNGDWNTRKIIIGKYEANGKKGVVYKQPFSNMIKASSNLNNKELILEITPTQQSSSSKQQEIENLDEFLRYGGLRKTEEFGEFDYIGLAFVINGATFEPSNTSGSYGVKVNLKLNESQEFTNYTIFDSSQFFGNPYWCDGMRQELLIEYPKGSEVKGIQLEVYQDGKFNDITNVNQIQFTNLEIYFGYKISKFQEGKLVQYIPSNRSLQYSFEENDNTIKTCPAYYALYHNGRIYGNKLKFGSTAGDLNLKWYKFQSGAAGTELSGPNYVDLWQSDADVLTDGWRVNLVDQSEIRIKMIAYVTNTEKPLYEHILNFNNTDKMITAEEEAQVQAIQKQQDAFYVKTYRSDDKAKFNATKFYAYDSTDNQLVSSLSIGLEVMPNDKIMKLTKGTITYNILSSIPKIKKKEEEKVVDGVLATQLGYFVNKTYKQPSKNENGEDIEETISYWTPLDDDGEVIYKKDNEGNLTKDYDFSYAATITCKYDYTAEAGSKTAIPAAAINLQKYLYPYRDNRIECTITQEDKVYKKIIDIDFNISNTAGTGYSLVISPAPGEFEQGMQFANYLYKDIDEDNNLIKTYKLKAQLFDQNHELIKGIEIYENIKWNIENPNVNIIKEFEKTDPKTGEITKGYWEDVEIVEDGSILTIHINNDNNSFSMIVYENIQRYENYMIVTATYPSWTSSEGVMVNLKTKYPLATFGCFNALYYDGEKYNTEDTRLADYKYSNDLLTQFTYTVPSRVYYNSFGQLSTQYSPTNLEMIPIGEYNIEVEEEESLFLVLLEKLRTIINAGVNENLYGIGDIECYWVINYKTNNNSKQEPIHLSTDKSYQDVKVFFEENLLSDDVINASIGLVIYYTRKDSSTMYPYYLFQQPILIERVNNTSEVLNSWDGSSIEFTDTKNGAVLSTAMVAGSKDDEGKFTGVMMGQVSGLTDTSVSSGIYGFNNGSNRFYLNNNAEFFVGDGINNYMNFNETNGLAIHSSNIKFATYKNGVIQDYLQLDDNTGSNGGFAMKITGSVELGLERYKIIIKNDDFSINTPYFRVSNGAMELNSSSAKMATKIDTNTLSDYQAVTFRTFNDLFAGFYSIGANFGLGYEINNSNGPLIFDGDKLNWYLLGTQKATRYEMVNGKEQDYTDNNKLYIFPFQENETTGYSFNPVVTFFSKEPVYGYTSSSWYKYEINPWIVFNKDLLCYESSVYIGNKLVVENGATFGYSGGAVTIEKIMERLHALDGK